MKKKQKITLYRIIITAVMLVVLQFLPITGIPRLIAYLAAYLVIGYDILRKAGKGILNGRAFDENFLMALATLGAFFLAIWTKSGDYLEGIAVMLFYQIGELFQSYAVGKSRKNISALMDIRPDYANIEKDGKLEQVDPDEVAVGSIIVVQPGEKVPLDGVVESGNASLNTSALTGESLPRDVKEGDEIISGCINLNGVLKIRTTKEFGESTVSKILDLVENASSRKSRSEAFISRFAKIYTPAVCISAVLLGIAVPLLRMAFGMDAAWVDWIYRALTFLVVSCPCALVISIPLSFFAGIGGASHEGVLIKGSNYLEALSDAKIVVFDKTGTLTQGVFEVTAVHHNTMDETKLLEYAALAECASSHPISKSLQKAYGKEIDRSRVTDIEEVSGKGITAKVDGHEVLAGNAKLMALHNIPYNDCHSVGTIIHMSIDGEYAGHIVISDVIKPHSKEAIQKLKHAGVEKPSCSQAMPSAWLIRSPKSLVSTKFAASCSRAIRSTKSKSSFRISRRKQTSRSSATASTMRRCSPVPISASPWAPWAAMPPSKPQTLSSWTMTRCRLQRPSKFPASASASSSRTSCSRSSSSSAVSRSPRSVLRTCGQPSLRMSVL